MPKAVKIVNAPTPEQAAVFDEWVAVWQTALNLNDWRIERSSKPVKNAMACVDFNPGARLAIYQLGDFGDTPITDRTLSQTALHEVLHVFLHDLVVTAQDRDATFEQLEAAEHKVINVLEKILVGDEDGRKSEGDRSTVH